MRGDLALDEAAGDGLAVEWACGLETFVVVVVFGVGDFGIFEGAGGEGGSGGEDGLFVWGQVEVDGHVDGARVFFLLGLG